MEKQTFCSYYNASLCRSCTTIELANEVQIAMKENKLRHALSFFDNLKLEKTVLSSARGFRNRAKMSVTGNVDHPVLGILGDAGDLDAGSELLDCPIHHPRMNDLMRALPKLLQTAKLVPYNISEKPASLKASLLFTLRYRSNCICVSSSDRVHLSPACRKFYRRSKTIFLTWFA